MKKLFTLFALLMAIVVGAQAADEYTLGYPDETVNSCNGTFSGNTATFSVDGKSFTMTRPETDKSISTGNATGGGVKRYGVKFSQNVAYTITLPNGVSVNQIKVGGWANKSDATTSYVRYINDTDVSAESGNSFTGQGTYTEWSYTLPSAVSGSFTITFKGAETVANLTLICGESAPATEPSITTQPQDATYVIGTEDYPSMSVTATASAGELKYQWHIIIPSVGDIAIPGAEASTLSLATYATQMAAYLSQEGSYSIYCNVADDNDNVDSNTATLTVTATAPVTPNDPTFDKADGATIKAGDVITITSSAGSTIYYRWSGSAGKSWTPEAFKDGRTPNDSPCTTTTSTKGDRYVYAMAEINGNYSNITSIKVTVSENPVKGQLDKTSDAVDQNADAPAVPVFTLVDADGNPSPASMGAEGSTNDIFVKYVVTGTDGIITLNSDATAIESISTATAGTATATITITKNKDAYPIIDGEGTYEYTITVNDGSTPATGPVITTQPQDATYVIGTEDYPSMSVEATASAGELKYQWHIIIPSVGDIAIPGAEASTLSLATYASSPAFAPYLSQEGSYSIYCVVKDDNASVNTNTAKITVEAAEPVGGITITEEPSDVTYTIGDADYPSVSVEATAATGEITYDWKFSSNGNDFTSLTTMGITSASTATLSGAEVFAALGNMIPDGQIPAGTYYVKCTLNNEGVETDTRIASLTVKAAEPVGPPATPTFSLPAGSTIKAGEPVVITSDDGSQIYYNWSGKETGGYDEAALLGRTPKDSPASCTTSTTGKRYLYALAKKGDATSEIAIIGYTVEANPVKGQLDKTADVVDQYADAPALPVFTVVDAAGSPSTASIGDEKKDLSVKYELSSTATPGIVTLKADGSGIESISTATAGEAMVIITLTSNKNGYPLIDGETGVYSYTITVNSADPITPTFSFDNSTIGNNQTAQICVGDKKDMDGIKISEVEYLTQGVTVNIDNGVVTPTPGFVGTATFKISTSASADGKYSATTNNELTLTITGPIAVDPVFSLVKSTITAGETAQIQVGDKGNLDGIELNNVTYHTLNAIQSLDRETGVIVLNEGFVGTVTFTFDSKSVENKYNYTENNELTLTVNAPLNYTKSVNIEQLVLDNGVKYDIANEFAESYVEYANINALDSLNDANGKFQRNEPFLGLKLKSSGAYIKAAVKQGSTLKVKFGNIGDKVKVDINGTAQADIQKMTTKDDGYTYTVYEYTAADADAVVTFTTSSSATVVLKQIMIDEDIADVILPWAINKPATVENGTAEMPSSAYPEQQVTITATPADGYELDAITVTGASTNNAYDVDDYGTFIMPYEAVNVSVTFKQATAINGIAEDAEASDAANVKVIKNGKLYIGKYNVAGQRVK